MNKLEYVFKTTDAERGCMVMDWLNENNVAYNVSKEASYFVFDVTARPLQRCMVQRFFREEV